MGRQPDISLAEMEMDTQSDIGIISEEHEVDAKISDKVSDRDGRTPVDYSVGSFQLDVDLGGNVYRFADDDLAIEPFQGDDDQDLADLGDLGDFLL